MNLAWDQWILDSRLEDFVRQLCLLLPESPVLQDVDRAADTIVVVRLLESGKLFAQGVPCRAKTNPGQHYWSASRFGPPLITPEVSASLERTSAGGLRLSADCLCRESSPCIHAQAAIVKLSCEMRPELREFLADDVSMASCRISAEAAGVLQELDSEVSPDAAVAVRHDWEQPQALIYRLGRDSNGVLSRLSLSLAPILKSGGFSTARDSVVAPRVLFDLFGTGRGSGHYNYELNLKAHAQPADHRIAKQLFLAGALGDVSTISLHGLDASGGWWDELMRCGRLKIEDGATRAFETGPILSLQTAWSRSPEGRWRLTPALDDGALLVPTAPPKYVHEKKGLAGPVVGEWSRALGSLIRNTAGLNDGDLAAVRAHLLQRQMHDVAPPEVIVVDGGQVVPQAVLEFSWVPHEEQFDGSRSFRHRGKGRAKLLLHFDYEGVEVRDPKGSTVERWSGNTKTVYQRDTRFERSCLKTIKDGCGRAKASGFTLDLGIVDYFDEEAVGRLVRFQRQSVPVLVEAGWRVKLSTWWPGRSVRPVDFETKFGDEEKGWLDFSMTAKVDGYVVNMLEVLGQVLDDEAILASLAEGSEGSWSFKIDNGYWVVMTRAELAGLLPLLKVLRVDEASGKARITRFDVGALDAAESAVDLRLKSSSALAEIAETLRAPPRELPSRTEMALQRPARIYQSMGAGWCAARRGLGLGGVIADEYAVGKTLQTLLTVYDAIEETDSPTPSLIVVTKTLFYEGRWQSDIAAFLPDLKVVQIGSGRFSRRLDSLEGVHAVLTTYDVLAYYAEAFAAVAWNVVAFDEAHRLGNPATKLYRAADALRARQKIAVTGSPMQNSPRELWAIMNLTVPGLLRDRAWFNKAFPRLHVVPTLGTEIAPGLQVEQAERANIARLKCLGKMISPYQLRRTNKDVGRTLPPVVTVERRIALPQWQANFYEGLRVSTKAHLEALLAQDASLPVNKMHVFTVLLGLRQAACDPRLVKGIEDLAANEPSGKQGALQEICEEFTADGKRVVIVSEWTEWLTLIDADLRAVGVEVASLTGKLSGPQRKSQIDRFRSGEAMVMLLQLNFAEGVELPEGDVLVVAEPWWNEKKIEQAIARLRRDERDKSITVIRLHVPGSVEEGGKRIAQRKLDDINAVNEGGRAGSAALSAEDIEAFLGLAEREDRE